MGMGLTLAGCTTEQKVVTQSNAAGGPQQKLRRVLIAVSYTHLTLPTIYSV